MPPVHFRLILATAASLALNTANAGERQFGTQAPFVVNDLPAGLLKSGLQALPPQAHSRAMEWLHSFDFPASDVAHLRVDQQGAIYYVDPQASETVSQPEASTQSIPSVDDVFLLHSKPGASRVIFVDFDGAIISGTAWNTDLADPLYAKAFDTDGDPQNFNESERNAIAEIWHRIAEDYAAFDVDVTTEDPGSFNSQTGHLLITDDVDVNGNPMPSQGAGGVAYVNVWGMSSFASKYSPAFVYGNNLGPDFAPYIAEAGSHEVGHNLGLSHDGGTGTSYYSGHGSGWVSWGPIMGTGYRDNVSQWSKGEYVGANNQQDDIAIINSKLTFSPDDHGDAAASATLLVVAEDGSVSATNPETDPFNSTPANKGIIGGGNDLDVFFFNAGSGTIDLTITPSWAAWPRSSTEGRGTNLDIQATLYDESGSTVATSDPLDDTNARINTAVGGGSYTLEIKGVGNSVSPYTDYGSQGQYYISGFVPVGEPGNPPQPPAAPSQLLASDAGNGTAQLSWIDNSDNETGFEIERETYHQKRRRWQSTSLIATTAADVTSLADASGSGLFRYRARAINAVGSSTYTAWTEVSVTDTSSGGGDNGGSCKGGPKKCG